MRSNDSFIVTMPVGELGTNCYIVLPKEGEKAAVIDPGAEGARIAAFLQGRHLDLEQIVLTHGHIDHVFGLPELLETLDPERECPIRIHPADRPLLDHVDKQASFMGCQAPELPRDLEDLNSGSYFNMAGWEAEIIHTPGHSPGSVCFHFRQDAKVITGDTLFNGGVGRTDLDGGSGDQLRRSLMEKVLVIDPETIAYPGHGSTTTVGEARLFVREMLPYIR